MTPAELAAVREDVNAAVARSSQNDPSLLPEMLQRLLTAVGDLATDPRTACYATLVDWQNEPLPTVQDWADGLLRECQIRAVSGIPFAEATDETEPHWTDHL